MDLTKLYEILAETTAQFRKGEIVTREQQNGIEVTTIDAMPPATEADGLTLHDLHFLQIGVDMKNANARKADLITLLESYPDPEALASGPSYITVGGHIGDQGAAFQLFALGAALGLWKIITPEKLGITGDLANQMAGSGYIMISGYRAQ